MILSTENCEEWSSQCPRVQVVHILCNYSIKKVLHLQEKQKPLTGNSKYSHFALEMSQTIYWLSKKLTINLLSTSKRLMHQKNLMAQVIMVVYGEEAQETMV